MSTVEWESGSEGVVLRLSYFLYSIGLLASGISSTGPFDLVLAPKMASAILRESCFLCGCFSFSGGDNVFLFSVLKILPLDVFDATDV